MRTTDVKGSKSPTRKVGDTSGGEARSWLHKRSDPELWPGDRHSSGLYRAGSGNPEGDLFHRPGQGSWTWPSAGRPGVILMFLYFQRPSVSTATWIHYLGCPSLIPHSLISES